MDTEQWIWHFTPFSSLGFEPAIWRQGREYKFGHRKYVSHFYLCSLLAFNSGSLAARSDTILRFHIFCIHQIIPRCQRINHYILLSKSGACTFHQDVFTWSACCGVFPSIWFYLNLKFGQKHFEANGAAVILHLVHHPLPSRPGNQCCSENNRKEEKIWGNT